MDNGDAVQNRYTEHRRKCCSLTFSLESDGAHTGDENRQMQGCELENSLKGECNYLGTQGFYTQAEFPKNSPPSRLLPVSNLLHSEAGEWDTFLQREISPRHFVE